MSRVIVPATYESADEIARVHVHSWQAAYADILDPEFLANLSIKEFAMRWRKILLKADSQTLVASQSGGAVGFINFGRCRDEGRSQDQSEIWALYVEPSVRVKGLAGH